jgi:hypothetical protein
MNKISLSVISFTLGVCCTVATFRLFVAVNNVDAQIAGPFVPIVPPISSALPVPIVPPISGMIFADNAFESSVEPSKLMLDGLVSIGNTYKNPTGTIITYGGGAFHLENSSFVGPLTFEFIGAAANTVTLLNSLGLIVHQDRTNPNPAALPTPQRINKPVRQKVTLNKPLRGDIASQYDGKAPR